MKTPTRCASCGKRFDEEDAEECPVLMLEQERKTDGPAEIPEYAGYYEPEGFEDMYPEVPW